MLTDFCLINWHGMQWDPMNTHGHTSEQTHTPSKADVTLVDLQRRLFVIRCCAKNRSGVTCNLVRFFVIFAVAQHVASFWMDFKNSQRNCVKLISVTSLSSIFAATLTRILSANCLFINRAVLRSLEPNCCNENRRVYHTQNSTRLQHVAAKNW